MRPINVILFSSGNTEKRGILDFVKDELFKKGIKCSYWRDLFANAHDNNHIALLPTLIKKIPSFDFAILICEGDDITYIKRNDENSEAYTMRDNVLFEIGLCAMALGLPRTILLTDDTVRMPDDFTGINDELGLKRFVYISDKKNTYKKAGEELIDYIDNEKLHDAVLNIGEYIQNKINEFSPIVIGAASSTACGYVENFLFRILERIDMGVVLEDGDLNYFEPDNIHVKIFLPKKYTSGSPKKAKEILSKYKKGVVPKARTRQAEFRYEIKNDVLFIYDYPTTLVTSYDTAKMILSLDADDEADIDAKERFIAKEMDLFKSTLQKLLNKEYIAEIVDHHYCDLSQDEQIQIINLVWGITKNRLSIENIEY